MAARSRSGTRSARPASASSPRWRTGCAGAAAGAAWPPSASASGRGSPSYWRHDNEREPAADPAELPSRLRLAPAARLAGLQLHAAATPQAAAAAAAAHAYRDHRPAARGGPAGELDHDLTRQHEGEPQGQRIIVRGRVLEDDGRPVRNTLIEIWQ